MGMTLAVALKSLATVFEVPLFSEKRAMRSHRPLFKLPSL